MTAVSTFRRTEFAEYGVTIVTVATFVFCKRTLWYLEFINTTSKYEGRKS